MGVMFRKSPGFRNWSSRILEGECTRIGWEEGTDFGLWGRGGAARYGAANWRCGLGRLLGAGAGELLSWRTRCRLKRMR